MVKPPMIFDTIFCRDRERARVSTLARATMLDTSTPRVEAAIRNSRMYMAALARDKIRLWAAFSSRDLLRDASMSRMSTRMISTPMTRITTAAESFLKKLLCKNWIRISIGNLLVCLPLWGRWIAKGETEEGRITLDIHTHFGEAVFSSSDLAYARPPSPKGKAFLL